MPPGRFWNTLEFEGQRISQGRPPSASSWSWMRCRQDRPGPVLLGLSCVLVTHRSFPNCRLPLSTRSIVFWAINPTAKRTTGPKKPHRWPGRLPLPSQSLCSPPLAYAVSKPRVWFASKRKQGTQTSSGRHLEGLRTHHPLPRGTHVILRRRPWSLEHSRLQPLLVLCEETTATSPSRGPSPRLLESRQAGPVGAGAGRAVLSSAESRPLVRLSVQRDAFKISDQVWSSCPRFQGPGRWGLPQAKGSGYFPRNPGGLAPQFGTHKKFGGLISSSSPHHLAPCTPWTSLVSELLGALGGGSGGAGSSPGPPGPHLPSLPGTWSAAPLTLPRKAARSCTLSWTMAADHSQERVAPLLGPGWWPWALQRTCLDLSEGGSLGWSLQLPRGQGLHARQHSPAMQEKAPGASPGRGAPCEASIECVEVRFLGVLSVCVRGACDLGRRAAGPPPGSPQPP